MLAARYQSNGGGRSKVCQLDWL